MSHLFYAAIPAAHFRSFCVLTSIFTSLFTSLLFTQDLEKEGKKVRVVSMPCIDLYEEQSQEYKDSVLPKSVTARVSVEAGTSFGWHKYLGFAGKHVGIDTFGASAPAPTLYEKFGITKDAVIKAAHDSMKA